MPADQQQHQYQQAHISAVKEPQGAGRTQVPFSVIEKRKKRRPHRIEDLTENELEDLRDAFMLMDRDASGHITRDEIKSILTITGFQVTDERVARIMDSVGVGRTGVLDFYGFANLMIRYINLSNPEEEIRTMFRTFDKDGSGSISVTEFCDVLRRLGMKLSDTDILRFIERVDKDGNNELDFDEFLYVRLATLERVVPRRCR